MKTLLQCHIMENRGSYLDDYSSGLYSRSNTASLGRIISDFILSWGPSFISDIYSWIGAPPPSPPLSEASWLSVCTEAPPATLEKPGASDLHCLAPLVCSVWPVPLEEESGPITSRRSETNMMSSSPLRHNRLQMRGVGPLSSLIHLTKSRKAWQKKKSKWY